MGRLFAVVTLLLSLGARAAEPSAVDVQRARAHYEAGSGLYQLGRYDEAIREFSAGYALSHRPQFALNIAQCYRMLGRYEDARDMIRRFLDEAPRDAPERPNATALLAETEQQIRQHSAAAAGPAPGPAAQTPAPAAATVMPPATPAATARDAPPPARTPERRSHRGAFIALGVIGGVLVVGGAVTLAVLLSSPGESTPTTALGTVRFGR